jgi:hypothetical protein
MISEGGSQGSFSRRDIHRIPGSREWGFESLQATTQIFESQTLLLTVGDNRFAWSFHCVITLFQWLRWHWILWFPSLTAKILRLPVKRLFFWNGPRYAYEYQFSVNVSLRTEERGPEGHLSIEKIEGRRLVTIGIRMKVHHRNIFREITSPDVSPPMALTKQCIAMIPC